MSGQYFTSGPFLPVPLGNAEIDRLVDAFRDRRVQVGVTEARAIAALAELSARRQGKPFPGIKVERLEAEITERDGIIARQRDTIARLRISIAKLFEAALAEVHKHG
jgi:hypothetical protein